jgi:hypothetical protein
MAFEFATLEVTSEFKELRGSLEELSDCEEVEVEISSSWGTCSVCGANELNPMNAKKTRMSDSAAFEDFLTSSADFL